MVLYFTARSSKERHTQIFMGRDKVENEDLIKYGLPEDIWCGPRPSTRIAAVEVANTRMGRCTTHSVHLMDVAPRLHAECRR